MWALGAPTLCAAENLHVTYSSPSASVVAPNCRLCSTVVFSAGKKKKKKAVCKWTHVIQTHVLQGPTVFFWQLSSMQFSVVNYGHHAAHYIPMTNLFYSWIYLPFESKSKNF